MFYRHSMRINYRIEPCKSALTQVRGMPFKWSLNPYMGCTHRCTFCYVEQECLSTTGALRTQVL
jgi:DNA repair photolyase